MRRCSLVEGVGVAGDACRWTQSSGHADLLKRPNALDRCACNNGGKPLYSYCALASGYAVGTTHASLRHVAAQTTPILKKSLASKSPQHLNHNLVQRDTTSQITSYLVYAYDFL